VAETIVIRSRSVWFLAGSTTVAQRRPCVAERFGVSPAVFI